MTSIGLRWVWVCAKNHAHIDWAWRRRFSVPRSLNDPSKDFDVRRHVRSLNAQYDEVEVLENIDDNPR